MCEEFGIFPVAVNLYLGGYDGPARETQPFRYRSGWVMVCEARMVMPFGTWRRPLVAAISDHGEVYSPSVAARLFEIPVSYPKCAESDPPEELAEIMDGLYWDFLGRVDSENLRMMQEEDERTDQKIHRLETRCAEVEAELWVAIRALRAEMRSAAVTAERRAQIEQKLALLLEYPELIARSLRVSIAMLRDEMDRLRDAILASQTEECEIETLFTVHWTARGHRRGMTIRFPMFQEENYSAEAWRSAGYCDIPSTYLQKDLAAIRLGA